MSDFEGVSINRPRDFSVDLLEALVPTRLIAAGAAWAPGIAARFPGGDAERGAYLGLPLLAIVVLFALRNRRRPEGRFLLAALVLAWFCSLGTALWAAGDRIAPLPWALVAHVPGFTNVLPARLSLFTALAASVVAALWIRDTRSPFAIVLPVLAVLALVPRLDIPVWSTTPQSPAFFADGDYRKCLSPSDNVFVVPFGRWGDSMMWQVDSDYSFRMAGGYIRPIPPPSYLRYPAIWNLHFKDEVPAPSDLRVFMRDKGVDKVLVADSEEPAWRATLAWFGKPTEVGGMYVYPGCRV
jgi:hypothetical protein